MTKDQKAQWVKALLSGKYKQGCGQLHSALSNEYCCLGVAKECFNLPEMEGYQYIADTFLPKEIQEELARVNDYDAMFGTGPIPFELIAGFIDTYIEPTE